MGFVNNNNAVTIQISFVKGFTQKDAIGHICILRQSQGEKRMKAGLHLILVSELVQSSKRIA